MKIIIILMITYIIYRIFFLFLSVADAKFPTIAQILGKAVVKMNNYQRLHMFDTSPIQVFHQPVFYCCFKIFFYYEIKLAISAALESRQNTCGAINFE